MGNVTLQTYFENFPNSNISSLV